MDGNMDAQTKRKRADLIRRIEELAAQKAFYYDSPNREFLLRGLARIQKRQDKLFDELEKLEKDAQCPV